MGIATGLTGAFALTRVMSSLLYGVSATDGLTFVVTPLALGSLALLASPFRLAERQEPTR
jgi:putative ABC transport system permease protein